MILEEMAWLIIWLIMGGIIALSKELSHRQNSLASQVPPTAKGHHTNGGMQERGFLNYSPFLTPWLWVNNRIPPNTRIPTNFDQRCFGPFIPRRSPPRNQLTLPQTAEANTKAFVENWRKSILGLIDLAEKNLELAKAQSETGDCHQAVQMAFTSVENIVRAMIHCCGGKPDMDVGQEEVLRMLFLRFKGDGKQNLEKAINEIVRINCIRIALRSSSVDNSQTQPDQAKTREILESTSEIINQFKRIIDDHFGEEIYVG